MSDPHAPHADASGLEQELLEDQALSAAERYAAEVRARTFPGPEQIYAAKV